MQVVWIKDNLYKKLFAETNEMLPLETGGMLLGYKDELNNIVITNLVGAGPKAIHNKYSFTPDGEYQQNELSRIYFESDRITTYLGDWHSHPYQNAYMSWRDRTTLKKIANTKAAREPNPIFIIIGTAPIEVKCWRYNMDEYKQIELLEIKIYNSENNSK